MSAAEVRHYIITWVSAFRVLLGWSDEKTMRWSKPWRRRLRRQNGDILGHKDPIDYVLEVVTDSLIRPLVSDLEGHVVLRQRVYNALTGKLDYCHGQANWDLFEAREEINAILMEYGAPSFGSSSVCPQYDNSALGQGRQQTSQRGDSGAQVMLFRMIKVGAIGGMGQSLERGAVIDGYGDSNWTPIMWAVRQRRVECARWLILRNANVEATTADGRGITALMVAAENGDVEFIRLLLRAGADINRTDNEGRTALAYAVFNCQAAATRILLDTGARVTTNKTALLHLFGKPTLFGRADIIASLIKKGARIQGMNDLIAIALKSGDTEMIKVYNRAGLKFPGKPKANVGIAVSRGLKAIAGLERGSGSSRRRPLPHHSNRLLKYG